MQRILIIDDDKGVANTIAAILERMGIACEASFTLEDGLCRLAETDFSIVLLDVNLPDGNGIENIPRIIDRKGSPLVIIMTAYSDPDGAGLAIESGAWDYLRKPLSLKDLKLHVIRALEYQDQKKQTVDPIPFEAPGIIGTSKPIQRCLAQSAQIVTSDANVLITGETGTGKELFARAIHDNSARRNGRFVVVDCSILSENFIESVLFGHERGSFTGADKKRNGLICLAHGGTLFLDEVGELPESIQASFLRVLQEKRFRPVGSEEEVYSDFRVICATNKDLDQMAGANQFRTDLLFRLKTFVLDLPPLRDRKQDIPGIALSQIQSSCRHHNQPVKDMSSDFLDALGKYDWPGNVRELINAVEISVTSAQLGEKLFAVHLPQQIRAQIARTSVEKANPPSPKDGKDAGTRPGTIQYRLFIEKTERDYLKSLSEETCGDIQEMIHRSGLSRTVLYRKLKKHKIS